VRRALMFALPAFMIFGVAGIAHAKADPASIVCNGPAGSHNPLCPDGPPGPPTDHPPCSGAVGEHNPNCPPPPTCPPATGPVSGGVVQPISDAIRNGGGGQLSDVIDQINCQLIQGTLGL